MPPTEINHELKELLYGISPKYAERYEAATQAFVSRNPDSLRQSIASMRELLTQLVNELGQGGKRREGVKSIIGLGAETKLADAVASLVVELQGTMSDVVHWSPTNESAVYGFRVCEETLCYLLKRHEKMKTERRSIENWSNTTYSDPKRQRRNKRIVEEFQEWLGQPIENLILHGGATFERGRLRSSENVARELSRYHQFLVLRVKKESVRFYENTIRSYLASLGLRLQPTEDTVPQEPKYPLTQEQVKKMVAEARRPLWKTVIAFLAQTGQKSSVLQSLRMDMIDEIDGYGVVSVPGKLENRNERARGGKAGYQYVIPKDTMKLIRNLTSRKRGKYIFGFSEHSALNIVNRVAKECGYQDEARRNTRKIYPITLRLYFESRMKEAQIDSLLLRYMMGYSIPIGTNENYQRDRLLQSIRKAEGLGKINVL